MDLTTDFVPIVDGVVEKALKESGKTDDEIKDLKGKIKNIFLTDKSVGAKIEELTGGAGDFPRLRASVRPIITLGLTAAFLFLVIFPIASSYEQDSDWWQKIFTPFMAVFNILLGFWFGERTALKLPGKQE